MTFRRLFLSCAMVIAAMSVTPLARSSDWPDLPAALAELHATSGDCDLIEYLEYVGRETVVLEEGKELWFLPCYAGAYNFSFAAYVHEEDAYQRLRLAYYSDHASWRSVDVLVNPQWDASTSTLTIYDMGRGIGDCGSRGEWRYAEGLLRLERFFHKADCDGEGEPGEFPLVYEAKPLN
ncbi:MAG: DUF1176 domain-containing protein [Rhizobiaceae bacterium]|nr:DUF1176 domain-containing protein [Rhizobiaceae bacterium]